MTVAPPTPGFAFSHPAHVIALGFGAGLSPRAPGIVLGVWACSITGRDLGVADHGAMVWDEIVAFLLVLAIVPRELDWQAAAFVLFRAFDIAKPPPIRWFEARYHGGFGVMFDDLLAAGYSLLALAVIKRLLG